jgi:tetratricopeptide (TPR) repeat protein
MPIGAGGSFQYVFIPASLDEEIVERKLEMLPGKEVECLTDELKGHFQQFSNPAGDTSSGSVMDAIKAQLAAKHGDEAAANLDPEVLKMFANQQMVDIVALQPGTKANGFIGVSMYVDDQGAAKNLPVNRRASAMAMECGMSLAVNGDAFIARTFDDEDNFERMDFVLGELDTSAAWLLTAKAYHKDKATNGGPGRAAKPGAAALADSSPGAKAQKLKDQGNSLYKKKKWKAAVTAYSAAIELQPSNHVCWANRAACQAALTNWAEAASDAEECGRLDPSFVKAWYRLGRARLELGELAAASAAVEKGLGQCPVASSKGGAAAVGASRESFEELKALVDAAVAKEAGGGGSAAEPEPDAVGAT